MTRNEPASHHCFFNIPKKQEAILMGHLHPLADYWLTQVAKGLFLDSGLDKVCVCIYIYTYVGNNNICVCA
jgi:hypothetical protein